MGEKERYTALQDMLKRLSQNVGLDNDSSHSSSEPNTEKTLSQELVTQYTQELEAIKTIANQFAATSDKAKQMLSKALLSSATPEHKKEAINFARDVLTNIRDENGRQISKDQLVKRIQENKTRCTTSGVGDAHAFTRFASDIGNNYNSVSSLMALVEPGSVAPEKALDHVVRGELTTTNTKESLKNALEPTEQEATDNQTNTVDISAFINDQQKKYAQLDARLEEINELIQEDFIKGHQAREKLIQEIAQSQEEIDTILASLTQQDQDSQTTAYLQNLTQIKKGIDSYYQALTSTKNAKEPIKYSKYQESAKPLEVRPEKQISNSEKTENNNTDKLDNQEKTKEKKNNSKIERLEVTGLNPSELPWFNADGTHAVILLNDSKGESQGNSHHYILGLDKKHKYADKTEDDQPAPIEVGQRLIMHRADTLDDEGRDLGVVQSMKVFRNVVFNNTETSSPLDRQAQIDETEVEVTLDTGETLVFACGGESSANLTPDEQMSLAQQRKLNNEADLDAAQSQAESKRLQEIKENYATELESLLGEEAKNLAALREQTAIVLKSKDDELDIDNFNKVYQTFLTRGIDIGHYVPYQEAQDGKFGTNIIETGVKIDSITDILATEIKRVSDIIEDCQNNRCRSNQMNENETRLYNDLRRERDRLMGVYLEHLSFQAQKEADQKNETERNFEKLQELTQKAVKLRTELDDLRYSYSDKERTRSHRKRNARTKEVQKAIVNKNAEIKANIIKQKELRATIAKNEENARQLSLLQMVFKNEADYVVNKDAKDESEWGIVFTLNNDEFYASKVYKYLNQSLDDNSPLNDLLDERIRNTIGTEFSLILDKLERKSSAAISSRTVNTLRDTDISEAFQDFAYYGVAGNEAAWSHFLAIEKMWESQRVLNRAKVKIFDALQERALLENTGSAEKPNTTIKDYHEQVASRHTIDKEYQKKLKVIDDRLKKARSEYTAYDHQRQVLLMMRDNQATDLSAQELKQLDDEIKKNEAESQDAQQKVKQLENIRRQLSEFINGGNNATYKNASELTELYKAEEIESIYRLFQKQLDLQLDGKDQELTAKYLEQKRDESLANIDQQLHDLDTQESDAATELTNRAIKDKLTSEQIMQIVNADREKFQLLREQLQEEKTSVSEQYDKDIANLQDNLAKLQRALPILTRDGVLKVLEQKGNINNAQFKAYKQNLDDANKLFKSQREFLNDVDTMWGITAVGTYNDKTIRLNSGTSLMPNLFGTADEGSKGVYSGLCNSENQALNDDFTRSFGKGKFDSETQEFSQQGEEQKIIAMCVDELRDRRSKYWAGNSETSQNGEIFNLVDEMYDLYCATEGANTLALKSKEQQAFDKHRIIAKIGRDDLLRKYGVEAYGLWFTALKNKQWDKLADSGILMATLYNIVRGEAITNLPRLNYVDIDKLTKLVQEEIDVAFPEEADEKAKYEQLRSLLFTKRQERDQTDSQEVRNRLQEEIKLIKEQIKGISPRYAQLEALEVLKDSTENYNAAGSAMNPSGTIADRVEWQRRHRIKEEKDMAELRESLNVASLHEKIDAMFDPNAIIMVSREKFIVNVREILPSISDDALENMVKEAIAEGKIVQEAQKEPVETKYDITGRYDYRFAPETAFQDMVTVDEYLNEAKEDRKATAPDWRDAHTAFGEILTACGRNIDDSIMKNLGEEIRKINTNFSRIASIAMDSRYEYTMEMATAAMSSFIESILHYVGGNEAAIYVDKGERTRSGEAYVVQYNRTVNTIRNALGSADHDARNKAIYNERILSVLNTNQYYYRKPEQEIHNAQRRDNPFIMSAYNFLFHRFWYDPRRMREYVHLDNGEVIGYFDPETDKQFARWDDKKKRMVMLPGAKMPRNIEFSLFRMLGPQDLV